MERITPKRTHKKFHPGKQMSPSKGSSKMGRLAKFANKKPPVAKLKKSKRNG